MLTVAQVLKLKAKDSCKEYADVHGLYLQVQRSGFKSWVLRFRDPQGKHCKLTLGPLDLSNRPSSDDVPVIGEPLNLMAARRLTAAINSKRARGEDVVATTRRIKMETEAGFSRVFDGAAINYVEQHLKRTNKSWKSGAKYIGIAPDSEGQLQLVPKGLADRWRNKALSSITSDDLHWVIDEARERGVPGSKATRKRASESVARQMASALRSMFTWLLAKRLIKTNPFKDVAKIKKSTSKRTRKLTDTEIVDFWEACDQMGGNGQMLKLMLLTGCRRQEMGSLRRAEVSGSNITIHEARSKNKLPHLVPLPPFAADILQGVKMVSADRYFKPGNWARLQAKLHQLMKPKEHFTLHDLRRTFSTGMTALGVRQDHVEATLNHVSGSRAGVAGVYNVHHYKDEKAAALLRWSNHIAGLVEGRDTKVVNLKPAA